MHLIVVMTAYFARICCVMIMRPDVYPVPIATRYAGRGHSDESDQLIWART